MHARLQAEQAKLALRATQLRQLIDEAEKEAEEFTERCNAELAARRTGIEELWREHFGVKHSLDTVTHLAKLAESDAGELAQQQIALTQDIDRALQGKSAAKPTGPAQEADSGTAG